MPPPAPFSILPYCSSVLLEHETGVRFPRDLAPISRKEHAPTLTGTRRYVQTFPQGPVYLHPMSKLPACRWEGDSSL